ncbi:hypothetical protein HDU78_010672 [Chytriomyces hyalinus]|nr:hypothetical protein HDU78_010672 [Chytriomyces hyalinus]
MGYADPTQTQLEPWQRLMRPMFVSLLCVLAVAGIVELAMQFYDQAFAAAGVNGALFLLTMVLGGLGAVWRRRPLLLGFVAAAVLWAVWALVHMLLVLNVVQISGFSQNTAFMGVANVAALYPTSPSPSVSVSATALATNSVRSTFAATGTVPATTTTSTVSVPSLTGAQTTISPTDSLAVVTSSSSAALIRRDDLTATATMRLETQTLAATAAPKATAVDSKSNSASAAPLIVALAMSIAYGVHALVSVFAVTCALLIPTTIPVSPYDSYRDDESMPATPGRNGADSLEYKRGDSKGTEMVPTNTFNSTQNVVTPPPREEKKKVVAAAGPIDILSPSTQGRSITAAAAAVTVAGGRTDATGSDRAGYPNGASPSRRPPRRENVDSPKSGASPSAATLEPSKSDSPAGGRPGEAANRSRKQPSPTTPRPGPSAISVAAAAAAAGGGAKKYVAGPHNAPAEVPQLKGRASVYSVYTVASAKKRPDSGGLDEDETTKSSGVGGGVGASNLKGGKAISTAPVLNRADSSKEPKVRCKYCGEKMVLSASASHNCPVKPGAKSAPVQAETAPLVQPEEAAGRQRRERGASVSASRVREQSQPRGQPVVEKLDGKKVKAVKRFVPQMDDELALEVGDVVFVEESFGDGWAYGTNEMTDESGAFPLNSVSRSAKSEVNRVQSIYGASRHR